MEKLSPSPSIDAVKSHPLSLLEEPQRTLARNSALLTPSLSLRRLLLLLSTPYAPKRSSLFPAKVSPLVE